MAAAAPLAVPEPGPRATSRSLPIALLRAREAVMARFRPVLTAHQVTEQQWRVIRILGEAGPMDATELSGRCCILTPSMTRILRGLDQRGLVRKARDRGDRRRLVIALSDHGRDLIRTVTPASQQVYAALEQEFGSERLEGLLDLLEGLAAVRS